MAVASASVQSTGQATSFVVPGRPTIPSGGEHTVGVTVVEPPCELTRTCVPRLDSVVHLRARLTNSSAFTLLPGRASVYLDGAFVSHSHIAAVAPGESFGCALGVDSALRVKFSNQPRKATTSGLMSRTRTTTIQSSITITNTSATRAVTGLRVLDQIPVSTDDKVVVKLIAPELRPLETLDQDAPASWMRLGKGLTARWASTEDEARDGEAPGEDAPVGKDGKIEYKVDLAPSGKAAIAIEFTVAGPADAHISGL